MTLTAKQSKALKTQTSLFQSAQESIQMPANPVRVIGIDPGISGAIAIVDNGKVHHVYDMPLHKVGVTKKRNQVDPHAVSLLIDDIKTKSRMYPWQICIVIERVQASVSQDGEQRTQGAVSSFRFGESFGLLCGVVACTGIAYKFVHPSVWKRHHKLIKTPKDDARLLAIEQNPEVANLLKLKKHGGRADAILIARHYYEIATGDYSRSKTEEVPF